MRLTRSRKKSYKRLNKGNLKGGNRREQIYKNCKKEAMKDYKNDTTNCKNQNLIFR